MSRVDGSSWRWRSPLRFWSSRSWPGSVSGSLALLSDAGHMLTDAGALGPGPLGPDPRARVRGPTARPSATGAPRSSPRRRTGSSSGSRRSRSSSRRSVGLPRLRASRAGPCSSSRSIGLVVNLVAAWNLSRGGTPQPEPPSGRTAHVLADAAGSVAAIVAAVLILAFGWTLADPITSIVISALILVGAWRLLRDATHVLMEGAPAGVDVSTLERVAARDARGARRSRSARLVDRRRRARHHGPRACSIPGPTASRSRATSDGGIEEAVGQCHVTVQPEAALQDERLFPAGGLVRPR